MMSMEPHDFDDLTETERAVIEGIRQRDNAAARQCPDRDKDDRARMRGRPLALEEVLLWKRAFDRLREAGIDPLSIKFPSHAEHAESVQTEREFLYLSEPVARKTMTASRGLRRYIQNLFRAPRYSPVKQIPAYGDLLKAAVTHAPPADGSILKELGLGGGGSRDSMAGLARQFGDIWFYRVTTPYAIAAEELSLHAAWKRSDPVSHDIWRSSVTADSPLWQQELRQLSAVPLTEEAFSSIVHVPDDLVCCACGRRPELHEAILVVRNTEGGLSGTTLTACGGEACIEFLLERLSGAEDSIRLVDEDTILADVALRSGGQKETK